MRGDVERLEVTRDALRHEKRDGGGEREAEQEDQEEFLHGGMRLPLHLVRRRDDAHPHAVPERAGRDVIRHAVHLVAHECVALRHSAVARVPLDEARARVVIADALGRIDVIVDLPRGVREERRASLVDLPLVEGAQDRREVEVSTDDADEGAAPVDRHDVGEDHHALRDGVVRVTPMPGGDRGAAPSLLRLRLLRQELRRLIPLPPPERGVLVLTHVPDAVSVTARELRRVVRVVRARLRQREQRLAHDAVDLCGEHRPLRLVRRLDEIVVQARRGERDDVFRLHELHIEIAPIELRRAVHIIDFLAIRRARERREAHGADRDAEHAERAEAQREEFAFQ